MTVAPLLGLYFTLLCVASSLIVSTREGLIRGYERNGVTEFLGVPYASPPVGPLRWKSPQPAQKRNGIYDSGRNSPICIQNFDKTIMYDFTFPENTTVNEDCLYLNVWTPSTVGKRPVMFWIHGGSLLNGGNSEYRLAGARMAQDGVVVVVINYRLGVFGFLAAEAFLREDPTYPATGNYGLEDQRQALKWVKDNIASFGGDPFNVTIMGESAGGSSVAFHLLMPKSNGLFNRAIMQSGAPFEETRTLLDGFADSQKVMQAIQCTQSDRTQLLACMRNTSAQALLKAQNSLVGVTAIIDGLNLPEHPYKTISKRKIPNVIRDFMGGHVSDEGTIFIYPRYPALSLSDYTKIVTQNFKGFAPMLLNNYPCNNTRDCRPALSRLEGDFSLICPTYFFTNVSARFNPAYAYVWAHEPYFMTKTMPYLGAFHSSEVAFAFSTFSDIYPSIPTEVTLVCRNYSMFQYNARDITKYWTNFGITGTPIGTDLPGWFPYNLHQNRQVLNLTIYSARDTCAYVCERIWDPIYKQIYNF